MEQTEKLTGVMNAGFSLIGQKFDQTQAQMSAGFQGIRDYLCNEKIDTLQHKVTQYENAQNVAGALGPVMAQLNALTNAIPPRAVPAYPAPQYYWGSNSGWGWGNSTCSCGGNAYNFAGVGA